jgi:CubicO group peptidase (beta-lactamase class C family)
MPSVRHVIPIALCALAALALQSAAVPGLPAAPASGATSGPLAEAVQLYRDAVARDELRGVVLHVAHRGRTVLHEAIGHRHQAYQLPMEPDTLFRMASNTKPVVASAMLMLVEEGRLRLEDPVAKHLASWNNAKSRNVTIAQLLTHSSGLRIRPIFYPFEEGDERTLQAAVAKFGAEGPDEPPGEYSYNNAGYNTVGALIEVVSGHPLEAFLKSRIYDPLGMTDTLNHEDETKLQRMATVYRGRRQGRGGPVAFTQGFTPGDEPDFPVIRASGGLISTTADYARFLEMWRKGGEYAGRRLLKAETVASAVQPRVRVSDEASYGYGWMIRADGSYYHTGSDGTMAWIDPSREIVGMVFTQSPGGVNPTARFRELVNAAYNPTRASSR